MKQRRRGVALFAFCLLATSLLAEGSSSKSLESGTKAVRVVKDLDYYDGADADPVKHKLNLYLPQGGANYPVVLFIHGGGWRFGDRNFLFDVYGKLGNIFASKGIGLVVASYRLSPKVRHPEHVKDVARAFAWTKKHLGEYGGDVRQLFVMGHSAGGHLVSLLATDETLLKPHGLSPKDVKGVIGISGVYEVSTEKRFFPTVFGEDAELRRQASPIQHVRDGLAPMLLIYGDSDFPTLDHLAQKFHRALKDAKVEADLLEVKGRDHFSILTRMLEAEDPALQASLKFIERHAGQQP